MYAQLIEPMLRNILQKKMILRDRMQTQSATQHIMEFGRMDLSSEARLFFREYKTLELSSRASISLRLNQLLANGILNMT